jgi:hypothetical protein
MVHRPGHGGETWPSTNTVDEGIFFQEIEVCPHLRSSSSCWYTPLSDKGTKAVASWTKKVKPKGPVRNINIFEYGYVVVVVNWERYEFFYQHISSLMRSIFPAITGFWLLLSIQWRLLTQLGILRMYFVVFSALMLMTPSSLSASLLCSIQLLTSDRLPTSTITCVCGCTTKPTTLLRVAWTSKQYLPR